MVRLIVGLIAACGMFFLLKFFPASFMTVANLKMVLCAGAGIGVMGMLRK